MVSGHSIETQAIPNLGKTSKGCSYKMFTTYKPLTYSRERDPILSVQGIREMELALIHAIARKKTRWH